MGRRHRPGFKNGGLLPRSRKWQEGRKEGRREERKQISLQGQGLGLCIRWMEERIKEGSENEADPCPLSYKAFGP